MKEHNAYGNLEVYSPNGHLMFRTNENRLRYYKDLKLVQHLGENRYQLLFQPKGLGHYGKDVELLEPRPNRCVCCGDSDIHSLTRHHVVPRRFRKHMPMELKNFNYRYLVMLCTDCHERYGYHENDFNDELATRLSVKTLKECNDEIYIDKRIIIGIANAILKNKRIPEQRREELKVQFKEKTGLEPTEANLVKVYKWKYEPMKDVSDFGKIVIDATEDLYGFQQMWLEHFNDTMSPKFLPQDLKMLLK
jgi:hypothetical protein